jgi:hypothetical protein
MRTPFVLLIGVIVGCTSSSTSPLTVGDAASDGQMCTLVYFAPGCAGDGVGVCDNGRGGACGGAVCDCHGMVRPSYCNRADVPFAYFLAPGTDVSGPDAALTCDPTSSDAATSH